MSPSPTISFPIREFVREQLEDDLNPTSFNNLLPAIAANYGFQPFAVKSDAVPPTLMLGRYDLPSLIMSNAIGPLVAPTAVVSVYRDDAVAKNAMQVTPSTFSGLILVSVDFYIVYHQSNLPPDGEAAFFSVEEAMYAAFCNPATYPLVPPGVIFNNEILIEQGNMEWNQDSWMQHIPCSLNFYRISGSDLG